MFNLLSITTPRSFSAELLASRSPACTVAWSLLCIEHTTSALPSHPILPEEPVFPHCSTPIMRAIPPCLYNPNEVKLCNSAHTSTSSCLVPMLCRGIYDEPQVMLLSQLECESLLCHAVPWTYLLCPLFPHFCSSYGDPSPTNLH